jgi:hypothetical protein
MQGSRQGIFETKQMMDLLSMRALDTKAKRKLALA